MDFSVEIAFWEDEYGNSPPMEYFLALPTDHQSWIAKRNDFFEDLTWPQLKMTKYFDPVEGIEKDLFELRYIGKGGRNYRLVCGLWKRQVIGLEMFSGSGKRELRRHVGIAIDRYRDWQIRHPL